MKDKIFAPVHQQETAFESLGPDRLDNLEADRKQSLSEIVLTHNEQRKLHDEKEEIMPNTVTCFSVQKPNRYAEEAKSKILQVKIFDVLFNEDICNLVYMRDITKLMDKNDMALSQTSQVQLMS